MPGLSAERFCAEISDSTSALADLLSTADLTRPVPTCPDWTLRQLTTHVGRAHRWAAEIVATRSPAFIPFREVPDGRLPDDRGEHPAWLRAGASRLVGAVTTAGEDQVWAMGESRPASFWARRMAHETAVHRADAQIAVGQRPEIGSRLAADGIDEWLGFLSAPAPGEEDPRRGALEGGRVLHIHATDEGLGTGGEWLIRGTAAGVAIEHGHGKGDVAVRGPASDLLLILVRRLAPEEARAEVLGDPGLLSAWLAVTPF